jgi:Cu/Ag efflux protein CusF
MALAFGACGNAGPKRPPAAAATTPGNAKVKTYNGRGIVTKIDLKLVSVELDHEKIEGLMDAMRMEFYVKEKSELETLRIGDKVEFVLEDNAGAERIIRIAKAE